MTVCSPRFISVLAPRLETFVALKRAMGRRYESTEIELRRFDRFVAACSQPPKIVTRELVHEWLSSKSGFHPQTQNKRAVTIRQFCLYMVRLEPSTYVPSRALFPLTMPVFKPHIYTEAEFRELLRAALELPPHRSPLRPKTIYTLLLVLYATGMRIGETVRLRICDVDLDANTIRIGNTKFFKSRWVPFPEELGDKLRAYLEARRRVGAVSSDSPFFINRRRRPLSTGRVSAIFHGLVTAAGIPLVPGTRRPRLHDVRHTFAVTRVLQWYREGTDVQAKLPLLATYLGHGNVLSTQVYLTATAELLHEASQRFEHAYGAILAVPPGGAR